MAWAAAATEEASLQGSAVPKNGKGILRGKRKRQGERRVENLAAGDAMALGEGGGDSGADALGKKQYIVVLRPIYGGHLGLGLGVQGVKCLAQGGGAAAQAVLVVGVLQQKGVVVPGAGRQLTAVVEQRLITVVADPGKTNDELHGKNLFVG